MSAIKLKNIIYLGSASAVFLWKSFNKSLYLLHQTSWQSSADPSGMSYISCRQRNYEINKAVNQLQSQGPLSSYETASGSRLAKNVSYSCTKTFLNCCS